MDPGDVLSDDDSSSSSDDSFCEHGYPLHEEPPTAEKLSDKAVIVIQDENEEVYDHMFLVPFMRGESPLNETIKQVLALDYVNGDMSQNDGNGEAMFNLSEHTFGRHHDQLRDGMSDSDNSSSSNDFRHRNNKYSPLNKGPVMMAKQAAPSIDNGKASAVLTAKESAPSLDDDMDELNELNKASKFQGSEHYKHMMGSLRRDPLEGTLDQTGETGTDSKQRDPKEIEAIAADLEHQLSDYNKLLSDLSSDKDDSLLDSNVDYGGEETPFKCSLCGWGFGLESDLTNHQRLHSGERPYQCEFCIGNFQDKTALLNHRRQHTGEKPFKCDICGTSFSQKHSLVVHKNVHTGEKRYKCDLCDSCFVCRSNLNVHMRIHTGAKPYTCEFCHSSYAQKSQLTVHKRMHTGEKPYKCQLCPAAFAVRGHLIHHIRVHTGEKPFKCEECGSAFTKRCSLRVHMRAHTGEKPYRCQFCEQAFHLKNMLTKHLLNFHRIAKKMPTPPQKEGDPPPSPLTGLVPPLVPRGPGRPATVARIPGAVFKPLRGSKSHNNPQGPETIGDTSPQGTTKGARPNTPNTSHNLIPESSDKPRSSGLNNQIPPQGSLPSKLDPTPVTKTRVNPPTSTQKSSTRQLKTSNQIVNPEPSSEGTKATSKNKRSRLRSDTSEKLGRNGHENLDKPFKSETHNTQNESEATTAKSKSGQDSASEINQPIPGHEANDSKVRNNTSVIPKRRTSVSSVTDDIPVPYSSNNTLTTHDKTKTMIKNPSTLNNHNSTVPDLSTYGHPNSPDFTGHNNTGYHKNMSMGFPGFGSQNSWVGEGYQSSPVAQRMVDHFHQTGPGTQTAAMKSMMEAYAAGMPRAQAPGMIEEYHQLYSGILGNSAAQGMMGQRFPGSSGPMGPGYSDGPFS